MTLDELFARFKPEAWSYSPNKLFWKKHYIDFEDFELFNEIYCLCKKNFKEVQPTSSGAIPNTLQVRDVQRFCVVKSNLGFELNLLTLRGCLRIILWGGKKKADNVISGSKALREIFLTAENFGVLDVFKTHAVDKDEGLRIKETIESPIIQALKTEFYGKEFEICHHIDFNSSYASRIVEEYPELRQMYEFLYAKRKEQDGYYKHCLTNSIGMMQSKHCVDVETGFKNSPYQLSHFAKIAINGTNNKVFEYITLLSVTGRKPLLINTDGIWYQGEVYHDRSEGTGLCEWKHDHKNCKLYIKSDGAYQFIEDNKVNSVVRGYTALDKIKPRSQWGWREIDDYGQVFVYRYEPGKGVFKEWVDVI